MDLLPDSRMKQPVRVVRGGSGACRTNWVPIFCANCGADGGLVPEENCNFAFALCNDCAEKWGSTDGTYIIPDEAFALKLKEAQLEKYGRELSPSELIAALGDSGSMLSKLAKEKP